MSTSDPRASSGPAGPPRIDLYFWPTPNGLKISVMLEECELPYRVLPVHIGKGEQFRPEYLQVNPNNKIPALVDHDAPGSSLTVFESGAILLYLAEKTGRFLPPEPRGRFEVTQWLMWQMSGLGPALGQLGFFRGQAEPNVAAVERFTKETVRLLGVLERQLAGREYIAGAFSIADIACYPWLVSLDKQGSPRIDDYPGVRRWLERVGARPGVQRGMKVTPVSSGG